MFQKAFQKKTVSSCSGQLQVTGYRLYEENNKLEIRNTKFG